MSSYLLVALAVSAAVVDIAFAPGATIFGGRAQVTLVLVALWAALRPQSEAMLLAPVAGLVLGVLGNEPLGASVLALAPVVLLGGMRDGRSTERRFITSIGLVLAATPVYTVALALLSRLFGAGWHIAAGSVGSLAVIMLLNGLVAAVLYWPLARLSGDPAARNELRRY